MPGVLQEWLIARGMTDAWAAQVAMATGIVGVGLVAVLANVVSKQILVRAVQRWTARTTTTWDDRLVARRVFHRLSHLAPALVIYHFSPAVLAGQQAAILEPEERRIQRALLDEQRAAGDLLDPQQHGVAVERPERDGLEDEQVQGSGQQSGARRHGRLLACLGVTS